jgi:hypothetical protein
MLRQSMQMKHVVLRNVLLVWFKRQPKKLEELRLLQILSRLVNVELRQLSQPLRTR